jgi:hypothetical protein
MGKWRKLHNEELHNIYSSPDIIRQVRWARHVAGMGRERKVHKVLVGKPKGRDHSEDQGVAGRMKSQRILRRLAWGMWIGFDWLRIGTGGGLL